MTLNLYERRVDGYPKVWGILDALRRSRLLLIEADRNPEYLRNVLGEIDSWVSTDGAMILSQDSIEDV